MKCGRAPPFLPLHEEIRDAGGAEGGRYDRGSGDNCRHPLVYA
jgi:hypothetical protein